MHKFRLKIKKKEDTVHIFVIFYCFNIYIDITKYPLFILFIFNDNFIFKCYVYIFNYFI